MNKLYNTEKKKFITYNNYKSNKKNMPSVMFLHGLMSHMNGTKAVFLENYCKTQDYNFITFDNFGHGKSSGNFLDETIGSWLMGVEMVLDEFLIYSNDPMNGGNKQGVSVLGVHEVREYANTPKFCGTNSQEQKSIQPTIVIGSSMGAWLAILAAIKFPSKICGVVALAPAIDFTETIWENLTEIQKIQMQQQKWLEVGGRNCNDTYPISYQLILEAKNHLLLNSNSINLKQPVHLIHGMLDVDVPYTISSKLVEKITSDIVVMKLIKDGHHNLARESDLAIIANSLEEIINY
ncbi:alpha/beta hydrolase [Candidatus Tisiphia endosymbiont of Hybos culiciformis]|uniref:alpha/beta hydrolase n=1 Tax=Candidatus Tisiphia endosymbiont of Hybos culiciformis TaxID=3139331 RepID=UPI003CCB3D6A